MSDHPVVLETAISQVKWCDPKRAYQFVPAMLPVMKDGPVFWLDQIMGGGVVLPPTVEGKRALTLLLAGPPGTGKSTMALEMCHRWAQTPIRPGNPRAYRILYLTSEAHEPWMRSNAKVMGWDGIDKQIVTDPTKWTPGTILVLNAGESDRLQECLREFVAPKNSSGNSQPGFWDGLTQIFFPELGKDVAGRGGDRDPEAIPDVVVIDSLNTLPKQDQRERLFQDFMKVVGAGPRILIAVFNSSEGGAGADFWEFATDVVVRLDRKSTKSGYLVRTIEVVKARYQEHAFGKHQLKTYRQDIEHQLKSATKGSEHELEDKLFKETFEGLLSSLPPETPDVRENRLKRYAARASKLMRAHPYRSSIDGGLAIFPSIHYVLSRYKRATPTDAGEPIKSAIPDLTTLLHEGYPRGRCTAFIGGRGGHKSHLAYVELLDRVKNGKGREKAVIVSLRDDEGVTRQTMEKILKDRWNLPEPRVQLLRWEAQGLLDVTYYPPGYITPEEFFHRLMLSINRLKADDPDGTSVTLLFNSLDQLSSRFPLCVEEEVFIPGIIQMLSGERVSSFFVAAKEETRAGYYGLETMAELILEFERKEIKRDEMLRYVSQSKSIKMTGNQKEQLNARYARRHQAVVVEVVRHAGGQAAGARAVLELVEDGDPLCAVCSERDLVVLPFLPASDSPLKAHARRKARGSDRKKS